jgi:hypothetical protein
MYMNMTIIMTMNIYISKANEDWLRQQGGSMSGIINAFLDAEREAGDYKPVKTPLKMRPPKPQLQEPSYSSVPSTPKLKVMDNDALKALLGDKAKPIKDEPRHICKEDCYHWVWNTDAAKFINSVTGETREAPDF